MLNIKKVQAKLKSIRDDKKKLEEYLSSLDPNELAEFLLKLDPRDLTPE